MAAPRLDTESSSKLIIDCGSHSPHLVAGIDKARRQKTRSRDKRVCRQVRENGRRGTRMLDAVRIDVEVDQLLILLDDLMTLGS
jgi:hypothetical protein